MAAADVAEAAPSAVDDVKFKGRDLPDDMERKSARLFLIFFLWLFFIGAASYLSKRVRRSLSYFRKWIGLILME